MHGAPAPYPAIEPFSAWIQKQVPVEDIAAAANVCPLPKMLMGWEPPPATHDPPVATEGVSGPTRQKPGSTWASPGR